LVGVADGKSVGRLSLIVAGPKRLTKLGSAEKYILFSSKKKNNKIQMKGPSLPGQGHAESTQTHILLGSSQRQEREGKNKLVFF